MVSTSVPRKTFSLGKKQQPAAFTKKTLTVVPPKVAAPPPVNDEEKRKEYSAAFEEVLAEVQISETRKLVVTACVLKHGDPLKYDIREMYYAKDRWSFGKGIRVGGDVWDLLIANVPAFAEYTQGSTSYRAYLQNRR